MNTWDFFEEDIRSRLDAFESIDLGEFCKNLEQPRRDSAGRGQRRALGTLDRNSLTRAASSTPQKPTRQQLHTATIPTKSILPAMPPEHSTARPGAVGMATRSDVFASERAQFRDSLVCREPHLDGSEDREKPPVQDLVLDNLTAEQLNTRLNMPVICGEADLQFLYTDIIPPKLSVSWFGSKGNCRGWEMLRFQEQARIGRRKLLVLRSETQLTLTVLVTRGGIPLVDLSASELQLESVKAESHASDCMGSGVPAEKNLANCSLCLEVQLRPDQPEARILMHCERMGRDRRRDPYTIMVLDSERSVVVCSWDCHVYNLKYESMNKKSAFVPSATGAAPSHFQLDGSVWTQSYDEVGC